MDTNKKTRDYISAFADGELPEADLELALASLREADGQGAWDLYHRIGDALRAEAGPPLSPGFNARLALRLALEPTLPRRALAKPLTPTDALAAIAPSVVNGLDAPDGAKVATQSATPLETPIPEAAPAAAKRL